MLNITSWNVKGLKSPHKRGMVLRHLKKLRTDVALLQETHLPERDFQRMRKQWVGEVVGSPAIGKKAGVLVLIRKGINMTIADTESDREGRRVSVVMEKGTLALRITNIYAPNSPTLAYFQELTALMAQKPQAHHYVGGDFNCHMIDSEDRSGSKTSTTHPQRKREDSPLMTFAVSMQLTDIWRNFNPIERQYTYYSPTHKTFSRIDYILGTADTLSLIDRADIHEIVITDHAPDHKRPGRDTKIMALPGLFS